MALPHEPERALAVAAAAGVLAQSWPVRGDLDGIQWEWLCDRLRELAIEGRFWSEAIRAGIALRIPAVVRDRLAAAAQATAATNALLGATLVRAGDVLDTEGISWMPIKGAALRLVSPEYASTRVMSDIDLLVRPADLVRAARALRGTFRLKAEPREYARLDADVAAAMQRSQCVYAFADVDGAVIELHHAIPGVTSLAATDGIFARSRVVPARTPMRVPSPEDLLGTACVHVLVHHAGVRELMLRHLSDVAELTARGASADSASALYDGAARDAVARSIRELADARADTTSRRSVSSRARRLVEPGFWGRGKARAGAIARRSREVLERLRLGGRSAVLPPPEFMVRQYGPHAQNMRLGLLHLRRWAAIIARTLRGRG